LPSTAIAAGGTLIRAQVLIELLGGEVAELILHADHPSLGAKHDQIEANAFAKVAVAASKLVLWNSKNALVLLQPAMEHFFLSGAGDLMPRRRYLTRLS
jgi:hypothetical protein